MKSFWNKKADVRQVISMKSYGPARTKKEWSLAAKKPYGDADKDKLMNYFDCKPSHKKHREPIPGSPPMPPVLTQARELMREEEKKQYGAEQVPPQAKARTARTGGFGG